MPTRYKGSLSEQRALDTYIKVRRVANTIDSQTIRQLKKTGLTPPQFAVLEALFHCGPMHACSLSEKLLVSGGNLTVVVNNLIAHKWIERHADETDRRYYTLSLTAAGRDLIQNYFPDHARFIAAMLSALTESEQLEFARLAKKLGTAIQTNAGTELLTEPSK